MSEREMLGHFASRLGAKIGNWNDRHIWHLDRIADAPRWRQIVDRIAGWLYRKGDR